MSRTNRFTAEGSPLHGKAVPLDWKRLDECGKKRALVAYGYAQDYRHACKIMGKHAAAVTRERRLREEDLQQRLENRRHPEGLN